MSREIREEDHLLPQEESGAGESPSLFRELYDLLISERVATSRLGNEGVALERWLERLLSDDPPEITILADQVKIGPHPLSISRPKGWEKPDPFAQQLRGIVIHHIQARLDALRPDAMAQLNRAKALLSEFPTTGSVYR